MQRSARMPGAQRTHYEKHRILTSQRSRPALPRPCFSGSTCKDHVQAFRHSTYMHSSQVAPHQRIIGGSVWPATRSAEVLEGGQCGLPLAGVAARSDEGTDSEAVVHVAARVHRSRHLQRLRVFSRLAACADERVVGHR